MTPAGFRCSPTDDGANIHSSSSCDQKKYEKKAEKKINKAAITNREKLQKQLNELTAPMPEQQKMGLKQMMERMPP